MDYDDIYNHVTQPEEVYLLHKDDQLVAMGSYSRARFSGYPSLVVEGIAVSPEMQGRGVFREITANVENREEVICLRTQNPRMYRALEKYCKDVYPGQFKIPSKVREIREEFADSLNCEIDENGVVKGYYGGLFYGKIPYHEKVNLLFEELGVNLDKGDALLLVGIKYTDDIELDPGVVMGII